MRGERSASFRKHPLRLRAVTGLDRQWPEHRQAQPLGNKVFPTALQSNGIGYPLTSIAFKLLIGHQNGTENTPLQTMPQVISVFLLASPIHRGILLIYSILDSSPILPHPLSHSVHLCACVCVCACACMCMCVCVCVYIHANMCVCVCVCVCVRNII